MTYWLTEDAFVPMLTGGFVSILLLLMAYSARNKVVMYVALVIAAITVGIVVTEQSIVTDRESVTDLVYQLAGYARKNEIESIAGHMSGDKPQLANRLRNETGRYEIEGCSIVGVNEFSVRDGVAKIEFVVWGQGRERRGGIAGAMDRKVLLTLRRQGDASWKIIDYSHSDPRAGLKL